MIRKICFVIFTVLLVISLLVGVTGAFYTDSVKAHGDINAGTVDILIREDFNPPTNWTAGQSTTKSIYIDNVGSKRAYVRVRAAGVWQEQIGNQWYDTALDISNVQLSHTGVIWEYKDGYYYYKEILMPGTTGETLTINTTLLSAGPEYSDHRFKLKVTAEAVQVTNGAYEDVWGSGVLPSGTEILSLP